MPRAQSPAPADASATASRRARWTRRGWGLVVALLLSLSHAPAGESPSPKPAIPLPVTVEFRTQHRRQLHLAVDGRQLGLTPLTTSLPAGRCLVTAGADGLEPVAQEIDVKAPAEGKSLVAELPDTRFDSANWMPAVGNIVRAIRKNPRNAHLPVLAALVTPDAGDARELLARAGKAAESDPLSFIVRARLASEATDTAGALAAIAGAERLAPRSTSVLREKTRLLIASGDLTAALAAAETAIQIETEYAGNYVRRGRVRELSGDRQGALQDFAQALKLDASDPAAREGIKRLAP